MPRGDDPALFVWCFLLISSSARPAFCYLEPVLMTFAPCTEVFQSAGGVVLLSCIIV